MDIFIIIIIIIATFWVFILSLVPYINVRLGLLTDIRFQWLLSQAVSLFTSAFFSASPSNRVDNEI